MARGGARPGAGRKKGAKGQAPKTKEAQAALKREIDSGEDLPLPFMLKIMRNKVDGEKFDFPSRFEAAKAAAPFIHPKLSSIATVPMHLDLTLLTDKELDLFEALVRKATPTTDNGPDLSGSVELPTGAKSPPVHGGEATEGRKRRGK